MTDQNTPNQSKLAFFPITLFGAIMGYTGLSLVFQKATAMLGVWSFYYQTLSIITILFFTIISVTYLAKLIKHTQAVRHEFNHPIASNFFSAISISLMLIATLLQPEGVQTAAWIWYLGASLQLLLTLVALNSWIHHEKWQLQEMTPAWFIPMVGNIIAPLGAIHFASIEVAWFFFSIGLIFWLILKAIVMYRLFFHPPMMALLQPLLFIFIAPPAVGFLSYMAMNGGQLDEFARILFYIGLFFTLLLLTHLPKILKMPFAISWWAITFPLAAMANASLVMFEAIQIKLFGFIAALLLAILAALVLHLTLKTFKLMSAGKLCVPPQQPKTPQEDRPK